MNVFLAIAVTFGLPLAHESDYGTTWHASRVVRWVAGRLSVSDLIDSFRGAATAAGNDVLYAGKGSRGKRKDNAINPWPMSRKQHDDALTELIMLGIGLVALLVLWIVAYQTGSL